MGRRSPLVAVLAVGVTITGCMAAASPSPSPSIAPSAAPSVEPSAPSEAPSVEPSRPPAGWRQLTVAGGPSARSDHTWTVDPEGEIAYLFGGRPDQGSAALADLWAYDLATDEWNQLAGGPPPRFGHNAAWVPGVGVVIFAGQAGSTFYNDLWAYDPESGTWAQLAAGGAVPVARYGSCAALGPDGRLWVSHGFTREGRRFNDTRAYDFGAGTWTDETPPGELPIVRCLHGCWWTATDRFVLYAGQTDGIPAIGDRWALQVGSRPGTNAWTEITPASGGPAARNLYASTRWDEATVIFGGQNVDRGYLADTWLLTDDGRSEPVLGEAPGPSQRSGAELAADLVRGRALLFGGTIGGTTYAELWELTVP
jgi:hypothetical protein